MQNHGEKDMNFHTDRVKKNKNCSTRSRRVQVPKRGQLEQKMATHGQCPAQPPGQITFLQSPVQDFAWRKKKKKKKKKKRGGEHIPQLEDESKGGIIQEEHLAQPEAPQPSCENMSRKQASPKDVMDARQPSAVATSAHTDFPADGDLKKRWKKKGDNKAAERPIRSSLKRSSVQNEG